ncbi:MAG TPA: Dabb family protein [Candidatus Acidoferrales bacterium]|nr:Dabb family protein [Candidatus Acidoferrales bacterium]
MEPRLRGWRTIVLMAAALVVFGGGYAAGANRYGTPKTLLHVVIIQWKPGTTAAQKQQVLEGVRQMAARIPGVRNVWLKPARMGSLQWNAAFAIEFDSAAAADRYANAPAHQAWSQMEDAVRAASLNVQVTN